MKHSGKEFVDTFVESMYTPRKPEDGDPKLGGPCEIGDAIHSIAAAAYDLSRHIRTLRAVNMDRMADSLECIQDTIRKNAEHVTVWVADWQTAELNNSRNTALGLFAVAVKMSGAETERDKAVLELNQLKGDDAADPTE